MHLATQYNICDSNTVLGSL